MLITARRRFARAVVALLLLAALGTVIVWHFTTARPTARPAAATVPPGTFHLTDDQLRSIAIEPIVTMPFHSEEVTDGKIAFNGDTLTPVYSPYSGRVTHVIAAPGAVVKRGEPLFELAASEFAQGETDLLTGLAQLKLSTINEARKHAAYEARGGSLQDWQQAQNDLAVAQANLASVRNRLRILGLADETIDAIGERGRPDALVRVTAPIGGLVVDRQLGPGQVLQAGGTTALYTIADLSTVWVIANVRELDAPQVRPGQSAIVHVLALPEREYRARLNYVGATVDPASRRVPVRAVIDSADGALKPEMFATVAITTSAETEAPAVPQDAVIHEGDSARVWVMLSDHDVGLRRIRIGREHDGKVEVLEGLTAGQRVVTRGALFIDRAAGAG
ncbi:MAG: efflux RND transporter periplasmic adaptor subunit [Steroidobacterales bacterium]